MREFEVKRAVMSMTASFALCTCFFFGTLFFFGELSNQGPFGVDHALASS
jgi:hypothetical protein